MDEVVKGEDSPHLTRREWHLTGRRSRRCGSAVRADVSPCSSEDSSCLIGPSLSSTF